MWYAPIDRLPDFDILIRQIDAGDAATVFVGHIAGWTTQAAAHIKHMRVGRQPELGDNCLITLS
ncbi:MAG TPA: hypothetical protein P5121_28565 [Caldilineaceae bacterium]|nr:hypothetical protein [Caldilineaceae bacterium]